MDSKQGFPDLYDVCRLAGAAVAEGRPETAVLLLLKSLSLLGQGNRADDVSMATSAESSHRQTLERAFEALVTSALSGPLGRILSLTWVEKLAPFLEDSTRFSDPCTSNAAKALQPNHTGGANAAPVSRAAGFHEQGASAEATSLARAVLVSNLGCVHLEVGKQHLAELLFAEALNTIKTSQLCTPLEPQRGDEGAEEASTAGIAKLRHQAVEIIPTIAFNCGLQQLACEKPDDAIQSFGVAASRMCTNAQFWYRMAEAYCMQLKRIERFEAENALLLPNSPCSGLVEDRAAASNWQGLDVFQRTLNMLPSSRIKVVVPPMHTSSNPTKSEVQHSARSCLLNALMLSEGEHIPQVKEQTATSQGECITSSNTTQAPEDIVLVMACYTLLSYVELSCKNYVVSIAAGQKALFLHDNRSTIMSEALNCVSAVYVAEALCCLGREDEAATALRITYTS